MIFKGTGIIKPPLVALKITTRTGNCSRNRESDRYCIFMAMQITDTVKTDQSLKVDVNGEKYIIL